MIKEMGLLLGLLLYLAFYCHYHHLIRFNTISFRKFCTPQKNSVLKLQNTVTIVRIRILKHK